MEDLAEKVESIEKRLDGLVENIKTSLYSRHENRHLPHMEKQPSWVVQLFESLGEISAELRTVKKTLSTRTPSGNGLCQANTLARSMIETDLHGTLTKIQCEPTPPSITESRGEAQSLADALAAQEPLAETQVNTSMRPLSKPTATKYRIAQRKTKATSAEQLPNEPMVVVGRKRKAPPTEIQPRRPKVRLLSEAVCGKEAFHRFRTLVCSWRDRSKPFFEVNKGSNPAVQLVHVISLGEERSHLNEFLIRFAKVKFANAIDKGKAGRTSADPDTLNQLMNDLKWNITKRNRTRLHGYLKEGRRWKRLCGSFDGLLCLIPPNREDRESTQKIPGGAYYKLDPHDVQQFHSLLSSDKFIPLFRLGDILQKSISQNTEVPEFKWESEDLLELSGMSIKMLAPLMEEFSVIKENEWNVTKYDWPKPDFWLWEWPKPPSWVPPSDTPCNLCEEGNCSCIISCLPHTQPRVSNEPGKGQGVRAVGVIYQKGQILGELLGEFVPLDTPGDGWSIEFRRPDLGDEPIAQLYSKEKGNWVRKINHSCDPSAEFRVMKISRMWRQMVIAVKDISHDEEITAYCGTSFLRGQGKSCYCSVCNR